MIGAQRARRAILLLTLLTPNVLVACSNLGCGGTLMEVEPVDRSALDGPVTLEARLTEDGDPIEGAYVIFFVLSQGEQTNSHGRAIGNDVTDSNGYARISFSRGLAALEPPSYTIHGYSAEFRGTGTRLDPDASLCWVQGEFLFP